MAGCARARTEVKCSETSLTHSALIKDTLRAIALTVLLMQLMESIVDE